MPHRSPAVVKTCLPLLTSTVLIASGCVYKSKITRGSLPRPPASYASARGQAKAPPVGKWWRLLGDPLLDRLMEKAFRNNLDLAQARARIEQVEAVLKLAGGGYYPNLSIVGSAGYSRTAMKMSIAGQTMESTTSRGAYSLSLAASYEIDLWGKVRNSVKAARLDLRAVKDDVNTAKITIAAQLADAYFLAVAFRAQLGLLDRTIKARTAHLDLVQRRYRSGLVTALDIYQARENLARAQAQRAAFKGQLKTTEHAIALLVGQYPKEGIAGNLDSLPEGVMNLPVGLPSQLLMRRPDLRAVHARLLSADAQVGASVAKRYPSLSLTASAGANFDPLAFIYNIVGNLTAPIFQGGRISAEIKQKRAILKERLVGYKAALLKAVKEVEDAMVTGRAVKRRVKHLLKRTEAAVGGLKLSIDQYMQGLVPYLTVLNTEQNVYAARTELIAARRELISARIQLARALGGGWQQEGKKKTGTVLHRPGMRK